MAILQRAAVLLLAAATAGCSLLVGADEMSSRYGEISATDASSPRASKADAAPEDGGGGEAGACDPSACGPARIFHGTALASDYPVVVDGGRVYFGFMVPAEATPGRIASTRLDGLDFKLHYKGDFRPLRIQLSELYLYATVQRDSDRQASARRIARDGLCAFGDNCEIDAFGASFAGAVAVTGAEVLWSHDKTVRVVDGTSRRALPASASTVKEMRVDESGTVFVLENGMGATGGVRRYTLGATALAPFVTVAAPVDLLSLGTEVYVLTADGVIRAYPKQGGDPRPVATGLAGARHIATDGSKIFITRVPPSGAASIDAVSIDGNSPAETLTTTTTEPSSIAVDSTSVYWTDSAGGSAGSVWRVSK